MVTFAGSGPAGAEEVAAGAFTTGAGNSGTVRTGPEAPWCSKYTGREGKNRKDGKHVDWDLLLIW